MRRGAAGKEEILVDESEVLTVRLHRSLSRRRGRRPGRSGLPVALAASVALLSLSAASGPAAAQPSPDEAQGSGWSVRLAPFLLLTSVDGVQGVDGTDVAVGDSALRVGWAGRAEAWRGPWGLLGEVARTTGRGYASPSPDGEGGRGFDLRVFRAEATAARRVGRGPAAGALVLLAGARYVRHTRELDPSGSASPADRVSKGWVDPVAGARYVSTIGEPFRFAVAVTLGGATGSDFTWVIDGTLSLRLFPWARLLSRYRYEEAEFDAGRDYRWDGRAQGWILGLEVEP